MIPEIFFEVFQQRDGFAPVVECGRRAVVHDIGLAAHAIDVQDSLARHKRKLPVEVVTFLDDASRIGAVGQIDNQVGILAVFVFGLDVLAYDDRDFRVADFEIFASFRRTDVPHLVSRLDVFFPDIADDLSVFDQCGDADRFVDALGRHPYQGCDAVAVTGYLFERLLAQIQKSHFVEQIVSRSSADGLFGKYDQSRSPDLALSMQSIIFFVFPLKSPIV